MSAIVANMQAVQRRIADAAASVLRDPAEITLLAVSKNFPAEAVAEAARAGQTAFGENYVQEAVEKMANVRMLAPELLLEWHFIGPVQSNKTRTIAENFDWVHAVDRVKIAQRLSDQRPSAKGKLNICLQINISGEASKSGVMPNEAVALAQEIAGMPHLCLRGLMAIPEAQSDPVRQRAPFQRMRELFEAIRTKGMHLDTLSMGMSGDLEAAIAEGATLVRIGTAIFGKRNYEK
jgi:pyridoxal phosphate enzyme (YggS family)